MQLYPTPMLRCAAVLAGLTAAMSAMPQVRDDAPRVASPWLSLTWRAGHGHDPAEEAARRARRAVRKRQRQARGRSR